MKWAKSLVSIAAMFLAGVLAASLIGEPVKAEPPTESVGPAPTFCRDIAPIVYNNCVSCHRRDEVGPFPLVSFSDVKKRADQIATITHDRLMPPWKPEGPQGQFKYERRLTDAQIATIARWVQGGSPEGNQQDRPAMPKFPSGWQLGKPDMILKVAQPLRIPAEGPDIYVHFVLPLNLPHDMYVRNAQILPSNRRVAHHGVPMLDGSGTARKLAAANGSDHYPNFGGPGFFPKGFLPGYAPGMTLHDDHRDAGILLPKGCDVVLQMHYHPTGKVEFDQPEIGLYFTDKKPEHNPVIFLMGTEDVNIPAGESAHTRNDIFTLPVDMKIATIWGHMHMIGKSIHVWARTPDGENVEMMKIGDWDFNWQDTYEYAKPFVLPKGTVVRADFTWDNSADNPRNPNSPPKRITLGEGSTDEMSGLIVGGTMVNPDDELVFWLNVGGHYLDIHNKGFKK